MSTLIHDALTNFFYKKQQAQTWIEYYDNWLSPCIDEVDDKQQNCSWHAVQRDGSSDLSNINNALELELHPDIIAFYCSFYAPTLEAEFDGNNLSLIQAWNDEDFTILQENIIGHLLMKKKLKQAPTVFIAATDDDQYIISLDNASGAVMLEMVGKEPKRQLADNLTDFINQLV
ncbi:SecY-interacting protein (plasmid) [Catenovulum sp. SX2]|uniref:SecY-interacting protein n=1 Tax=Catenovulum sp. SX2 TaxID=3398614 RepID=UPI003F862B14